MLSRTTYRGAGLGGVHRDPFLDAYQAYSSNMYPNNISNALLWAERIVLKDGLYLSAISQIVSYFVTDIEIEGDIPQEQKEDYKEFLVDQLGIKKHLMQIGMDFAVYGNAFPTFVVPVTRQLSCPVPSCPSVRTPMRQVVENPIYEFRWDPGRMEFLATCPYCGQRNAFNRIEETSKRIEDVQIVMKSPHEIGIIHDEPSGHSAYYWEIPEYYKQEIRERPNQRDQILPSFQLERAPWPVIQAVCNRQHLLFDPGFLFHVKDRTLSGTLNKGFGIPRVLSAFPHAYYVQLLRRMNESLALDYVVPIRLVSPTARGPGEHNDPVLNSNIGGLNQHFANVVESHRRDPASWHFVPFPMEYQLLGGEAKQLAPHELIELGNRDFFSAIEIPEEMFRGNLSVQTAPMAARLFESKHSRLRHHMDQFLAWVADRLATTMGWERVKIRLIRPTIFDDINLQLARLQLSGQGMVSQTEGLSALGLDFREQQNLMVEEQQYASNLATESEEAMGKAELGTIMAQGQLDPAAQQAQAQQEQAAGGGQGVPPAVDPATGAPVTDPVSEVLNLMPPQMMAETSPEDIRAAAQHAAQLLFHMSETQKDSTLIQLKRSNPDFHMYVSQEHEVLREQARQNGLALAQQGGGEAPA